jgi:hypothetical protein
MHHLDYVLFFQLVEVVVNYFAFVEDYIHHLDYVFVLVVHYKILVVDRFFVMMEFFEEVVDILGHYYYIVEVGHCILVVVVILVDIED